MRVTARAKRGALRSAPLAPSLRAQSRDQPYVQIVTLLDNFKDNSAWKNAFKAAVSAQNADLVRLNADLGLETAGVVVPNLINVELDHAEAKLQAEGLTYKTVGVGAFGIVVPADWTAAHSIPGLALTSPRARL